MGDVVDDLVVIGGDAYLGLGGVGVGDVGRSIPVGGVGGVRCRVDMLVAGGVGTVARDIGDGGDGVPGVRGVETVLEGGGDEVGGDGA